jgi:hypothetical protein
MAGVEGQDGDYARRSRDRCLQAVCSATSVEDGRAWFRLAVIYGKRVRLERSLGGLALQSGFR